MQNRDLEAELLFHAPGRAAEDELALNMAGWVRYYYYYMLIK